MTDRLTITLLPDEEEDLPRPSWDEYWRLRQEEAFQAAIGENLNRMLEEKLKGGNHGTNTEN